jgi:hypothetical protein
MKNQYQYMSTPSGYVFFFDPSTVCRETREQADRNSIPSGVIMSQLTRLMYQQDHASVRSRMGIPSGMSTILFSHLTPAGACARADSAVEVCKGPFGDSRLAACSGTAF